MRNGEHIPPDPAMFPRLNLPQRRQVGRDQPCLRWKSILIIDWLSKASSKHLPSWSPPSQCWAAGWSSRITKTSSSVVSDSARRASRDQEVHLVAIPSGRLPSGHGDIIEILYNPKQWLTHHDHMYGFTTKWQLSKQRSKQFHSLSIFTFSVSSFLSCISPDSQYCGHSSCAQTSEN